MAHTHLPRGALVALKGVPDPAQQEHQREEHEAHKAGDEGRAHLPRGFCHPAHNARMGDVRLLKEVVYTGRPGAFRSSEIYERILNSYTMLHPTRHSSTFLVYLKTSIPRRKINPTDGFE